MTLETTTSAVPRRDLYLISVCLATIGVLAWGYLVHLAHRPVSVDDYARTMANMGMVVDQPWTAADVRFTFSMWTVMMISMMSPSVAPVLLVYAGAQSARTGRRVSFSVLMFGLGYLVVWAGFSGAATFFQWTLQRAALLSDAMAAVKPSVAATILIASGIYQLTPLKNACLTACRSPLDFLMTSWHDGDAGALIMGTRHGIFCLGCCWSLMFVLFAVGVMNLAWVAALAALVLLERFTPIGTALARLSGVAIISLGLILLARSWTL